MRTRITQTHSRHQTPNSYIDMFTIQCMRTSRHPQTHNIAHSKGPLKSIVRELRLTMDAIDLQSVMIMLGVLGTIRVPWIHPFCEVCACNCRVTFYTGPRTTHEQTHKQTYYWYKNTSIYLRSMCVAPFTPRTFSAATQNDTNYATRQDTAHVPLIRFLSINLSQLLIVGTLISWAFQPVRCKRNVSLWG